MTKIYHQNHKEILFEIFRCVILMMLVVYESSAYSQTYPSRPLKWIITHAAGGLPDTVARIYAQKLSDQIGQPVIIDNKPGANGTNAAQALALAPIDGYTFLITDGSTFSINPLLYKNLSYDYKRDFVPISLIARAPLYLAVNPKMGVRNFQEFITKIKDNPGKFSYGSSGIGSTHHLSMLALMKASSLEMVHIPYKGSAQSVPALIGSQIDVLFSAPPSLSGFVKTGQVQLIASNASKRSNQEPNVPTISEFISGFDLAPIIGLLSARGTPQESINKINEEINMLAKSPDIIESLKLVGVDANGGSPQEFSKALEMEINRFSKIIQEAQLKVN
jgi:tripartite-type tricarboxylate transporter receptor subunit TctC